MRFVTYDNLSRFHGLPPLRRSITVSEEKTRYRRKLSNYPLSTVARTIYRQINAAFRTGSRADRYVVGSGAGERGGGAAIITTMPRETLKIASEEAPDTNERRSRAIERGSKGK